MRRDHPRMRGEHDGWTKAVSDSGGSSPHARGTHVCEHVAVEQSGIIPACAGNTGKCHRLLVRSGDHPRMRGEHRALAVLEHVQWGSSPHARGTRLTRDLRDNSCGIIPACAGNTCLPACRTRLHRDHPRMRGEHTSSVSLNCWYTGSSPHARGTRGAELLPLESIGIIPACAGNTKKQVIQVLKCRDHPRMRGEHKSLDIGHVIRVGSSPHARGTHYEKCRFPPIIISSFIFFIYFPFSRGKHGISITVVVRTRIASTDRI